MMGNNQEILVFPRKVLTTDDCFVPWAVAKSMLVPVEESMTWLPRPEAERAADLVQPIPCAIIRNHAQEYSVLRRVNEGRADLRSRISLVVGGHIDRCPGNHGLSSLLSTTLKREVAEELGVNDLPEIKPVGLVMDHSSVVASRHVGFVYEIVIADEFKPLAVEEFSTRSKFNGQSYSATGLARFFKGNEFDPWSAIIFANHIAPSYSKDIGSQTELPFMLND